MGRATHGKKSAVLRCQRVDEVKDIRDKVRAERRLGEMLREQKETVGMQAGSRGVGKKVEFQVGTPLPTLAEVGIDKKLSMRSQQLAAMPEQHFEAAIASAKETARAVSKAPGAVVPNTQPRNHDPRAERMPGLRTRTAGLMPGLNRSMTTTDLRWSQLVPAGPGGGPGKSLLKSIRSQWSRIYLRAQEKK